MEERAKAIAEKEAKDNNLFAFHENVYELLKSPEKSNIEKKALARVSLWKEKNLCSTYYIKSWLSILENGIEEYQQRILSKDSKESVALMHNSPFSFLIKELN